LTLSCSVNILENFADKNSNEALFVDAKANINNGDYDAALAKFDQMTGSYLTDRHIILWKATAYGGKCGFRTLKFIEDFAAVGSTTRMFPFLVSEFKGGSPERIDACIAGEHLVESIADIGSRTADENLLLALLSFAKMGNVLSLYTDSDPQDGVADTGVDPCLDARATRPTLGVAGDFYDADLREFGTGLTLAAANLAAVSSSVDFGADAFSGVPALPAVYDPTGFSAAELLAIQSLIKEDSAVGLGTNCTGDVSACHCP
jgi:hypothetical protein